MQPPSIEEVGTRENFVANMKSADPDLAVRIIELSEEKGFLNEEFALQLIKANPQCYEFYIEEEWEDLKKKRNIALFAVQQDYHNLDVVPEELKDEDFLIDAFSQDERLLDEHLPEWKTEPRLIRRIYELNPDLLDVDPIIYENVEAVNESFPSWKTNLKLIKHFVVMNPELFNEVDPSMYDNPELFEFIRQKKIPLSVLNKGIPQQERLKARMRDLRTLALTQKNPWNIGSMGHRPAYTVQHNLGGPAWPRGGKTKRKRKRKTKRR